MSHTIKLVAWGGDIDLRARPLGEGWFQADYRSMCFEPQEESPEMVEVVCLIDDATGEIVAQFGIEGLDFTANEGWWFVRINENEPNELEFVQTAFDGEKLPPSSWTVYKSNPDSGRLEVASGTARREPGR
jgi:hypothetical protein